MLVKLRAILAIWAKYGPVLEELWRVYGPSLKEIGVDIGKIFEYIQQFRDHPALTDGERTELLAILAQDPRTIGIEPGFDMPIDPLPPAENAKGFPIADYNRALDEYPDVRKLMDGDVVYQIGETGERGRSGQFYVAEHGLGVAGVPGEGWRQMWPEA